MSSVWPKEELIIFGGRSEAGFTKGLKYKFGLKSKIKILNVEIFVKNLRQIICLHNKEFTTGVRQNFVSHIVITLRLLQSSLKVMEKVLNMAAMSSVQYTSYCEILDI